MKKLVNELGREINSIKIQKIDRYSLLALLDEKQQIEKYVICTNYMLDGCIGMSDVMHSKNYQDATYYGKNDLDWALHDLYKKATADLF